MPLNVLIFKTSETLSQVQNQNNKRKELCPDTWNFRKSSPFVLLMSSYLVHCNLPQLDLNKGKMCKRYMKGILSPFEPFFTSRFLTKPKQR